ncbi:hypothetical protein SAMN05421882_1002173 [Nitrosomonas communis]|uniref:Uncharacterized protein n=1 Tax=Nitrosomonas communis TaxID=44574 RepID=A0A1H2QMI3_9PROT|nr:hypothetical protein [Nitrosomonas communis]SDW08362.1 hypothetical protein SAMN05421882_1002173 [Nitrosomonas communis]
MRLARYECEAANFIHTATDPNVFGYAFKVIIELACCSFAGSNLCRVHSGLGVVLVVERSIAAGVHTVADGNDTCVAIVIKIIYAFDCTTFGNKMDRY